MAQVDRGSLFRSALHHLFALVGSSLLFIAMTALAAQILYPPIFWLADKIAHQKTDSFFMTPAFDWRIVVALILVIELVHRFSGAKQLWFLLPLIGLLFSAAGFMLVGINDWHRLQTLEYLTVIMGLMQGLHMGLWAILYLLLFRAGIEWHRARM